MPYIYTKSDQGALQTNMRLDRELVHRHHPQLGLQTKTSLPIYARQRQKNSDTILPRNEKTAAFPIPMCNHKVWSHQAVRNNGINSTTVRRTRERFHSTIMGEVPLPRQRSRQHSAMPDHRTGVTILNPYISNNVTLQATT